MASVRMLHWSIIFDHKKGPTNFGCRQLRLRFESDAAAEIALNSLTPDAELNPHMVSRTMEVREAHLIIEMTASNAKLLRNSMNGIFDMLMLVDRVQTEFGPPLKGGKKAKLDVS